MNPGDLTTLANVKQWIPGVAGLAIAGISQDPFAPVITLAANAPIPLSTGLTVGITAVNGPTALNGNEYPITVIDQKSFSIPADTFALPAYTSGGLVGVSDSLLQRLISACSAYIQSVLNRTIASATYNETRDGQGATQMMLRNYPVTAVHSVSVSGVAIPARPAYQPVTTGSYLGGYTFNQTMLQLSGWYFCRGYSNVQVSYDAGFLISDEPQTIPGTAPYVLTTLARWNAGDRGVTYADGTPLAAQPFGAALAQGQYSVDANGVYYFAAADAGAGVLISYAMVPFDVEQAAIDMIGDWFKYRERIGQLSMGIEQQTVSFTNTPMTARAQGVIQQYKRVAPFTP